MMRIPNVSMYDLFGNTICTPVMAWVISQTMKS